MKREEFLSEVRRIVFSVVKDLPVQVYLFGSWARGEERYTSDIDVAIDGRLDNNVIVAIRSALEDSKVPYRVDVSDLTKTDFEFAEKVRKEGVLWKG